jgi:hypothetical protein
VDLANQITAQRPEIKVVIMSGFTVHTFTTDHFD